jgi:hypothetical protein
MIKQVILPLLTIHPLLQIPSESQHQNDLLGFLSDLKVSCSETLLLLLLLLVVVVLVVHH